MDWAQVLTQRAKQQTNLGDAIRGALEGADMVFVTIGAGGGIEVVQATSLLK